MKATIWNGSVEIQGNLYLFKMSSKIAKLSHPHLFAFNSRSNVTFEIFFRAHFLKIFECGSDLNISHQKCFLPSLAKLTSDLFCPSYPAQKSIFQSKVRFQCPINW